MKKRIGLYAIIAVVLAFFLFFNYTSVQSVEKIIVESVICDDNTITVEGKISGGMRNVLSVKHERIGDNIYITIEGKNAFKASKNTFKDCFSNYGNSVKNVYLKDKKNEKLIFENPDFGKKHTFKKYEDTTITVE